MKKSEIAAIIEQETNYERIKFDNAQGGRVMVTGHRKGEPTHYNKATNTGGRVLVGYLPDLLSYLTCDTTV